MAEVHTCDCGKQQIMPKDGLVAMGVSQKMYCIGECQEKVQEFLDARDEVHNEAVAVWNKGLAELYLASKDFELPDNNLWITE